MKKKGYREVAILARHPLIIQVNSAKRAGGVIGVALGVHVVGKPQARYIVWR